MFRVLTNGCQNLLRPALFKQTEPLFYSVNAKELGDSIEVKFVRSSGPGGQNVNKLNSKAEVRLKISKANWIPEEIREKLFQQEKNRINKDGVLIVTSDRFRVQSRNLKDAMDKIRQMINTVSYTQEETSENKVKKILSMVEKENEKRLQEKKHRSEKKKDRYSI